MDPFSGGSSSTPSSRRHHGHPPRTSSTQSIQGHGESSGGRTGETLRRGHSDGDVLDGSSNVRSRSFLQGTSGDRETWIDFIRDSSSGRQDSFGQAQLTASKAAIVIADRRKRLSEHQDEHLRRRASSSLSFTHPPSSQPRPSFTQPGSDRPFIGPSPPTSADSPPTQRIADRPLPQQPSIGVSRDRRSREITLPKWQPDIEVSKCPICGIAFSFWYRKHHCRKCGRVVCANCSPHRITIPRQFIVHSPEDAPQSPNTVRNPGVEFVDLTVDSDADDERSNLNERPQSSDYRIDPALGGGQEVRLCNPCVPDPNPLPHLPYSPPGLRSFDSFQRPERVSSHHHPPSIPGLTASGHHESPNLARRGSSARSEDRIGNNHRFDGSMMLPGTLTSATTSSSTSRRHNHAPRPESSSISPPGYSSIYGSAPDQTIHQRHLASVLQNRPVHHNHRHHASMGAFPTPYRHRLVSELDATAQRPAPQPQLREEDECPICHQALPPKGPDGSEVVREAHVQSCIETHFSSSGPRTFHAPPSAAPGAATTASAFTPSQASGARPIPAGHRPSAGSNDVSSASFQQRRKVAGMLVYHASEKDCVGENGEGAQECVICFEEFAVGDEMGRLECLCKFHKACIRQWWDTKGPGACPVHQEGT